DAGPIILVIIILQKNCYTAIPNDIINQSTPAECIRFGYFDTIISLYKKIEGWLIDDVKEAHAEEYELFEGGTHHLEEKIEKYRNNIT
ncbi:MAG: hypothetical protein ACE14P_14980, partial [Methanotrichaceae archaeon]